MKITLIGPFPPFRGGISDFNFSFYNELKKNHQVQIINFSTQYPNVLFPGKTQYKLNFEQSCKSERILSSINLLSWNRTAGSIIEFDPDVIFFQYWMPFFSFAYIGIIKRVRKQLKSQIISICHNIIPHENKRFNKYIAKRYVDKIDKFILMSKEVEADLKEINNNANSITLFHPIYDLFGKGKDKQSAKSSIGIEAKNIFLFFGLIREYKGLDILLKSIPLIKKELNDFKLIVAGECYENPQKYLNLIKELDIQDSVEWKMEFIPDEKVSDYFSAADVVVLPYKTATQSGVTQIAYNFDRPVIISDVGGLSEIVKNGETGYVANPNPRDISKAIIKFYIENNFAVFSENVKNTKNQYSWETFTNELLKFAKR